MVENTSQKYEARIADMWDQCRRAQAKRYLSQSEKFPAQGCLFNKVEQVEIILKQAKVISLESKAFVRVIAASNAFLMRDM